MQTMPLKDGAEVCNFGLEGVEQLGEDVWSLLRVFITGSNGM